ncbi:AAA family ATPase [Rubrivirga sp.]|uniref:AAA family ATPase n=1 Tax=Rubrivirga sp. TaxID=1885344 RepID=UPI003B52E7D3
MRIRSVRVENFRAIQHLDLSDLPDSVVVAGPNGCGKSSLFDALRLLKSAYGQYHQNEYQSWFGEFQIDVNRIKQETRKVLHDPSRPLRVWAEFELADAERTYLKENARDLYLGMNWAQFRGMQSAEGSPVVVNPAVRRAHSPVVEAQTANLMRALEPVLDDVVHTAELTMVPGQDPVATSSPVVELMFSVFRPNDLGVIDYHGPHRTYGREQVSSVNLTISGTTERNGHDALYNTQNKYSGVKTAMAQAFVRQLLAREFGADVSDGGGLKETLDELFAVFFPGKTFLGPQPTVDGGLAFPVRLESGREHDINELSSGEKEVLLGYLRLRNSAPRNSIVLLDEPELHLNPRLVRGLPRFYQKHLGAALGNQLWLITHSDALLREAVEEPAYAVYHMRPSYTVGEGENQLDPIDATAGVERVVVDLVGDLATYSPRSKVVFVEGKGSEFDESLVRELFPTFAERVNLISVGSKARVRGLHDLMERTAEEGRLDARFFSVTDRDFDGPPSVDDARAFQWDVYHVENYLLEPRFVREAMVALALGADVPSEVEILTSLRSCAGETVDELIRIKMDQAVNRELVECLSTRYDPALPAHQGLRKAAERSMDRVGRALRSELALDALMDEEIRIREELNTSLDCDQWKRDFRGRDVLRRFVGRHQDVLGVPYEKVRNIIVNRMREASYRPPGMETVVKAIMKG